MKEKKLKTKTTAPVKKPKQSKTALEEYVNGQPCKHEDCSNDLRRLPCRYCGRVKKRGIVIIQDRTGSVYLERLNSFNIKQHNELSPEAQETNTIEMWRAPKYLD